MPFKEIFVGDGVEGFFREALTFAKGNAVLEDMHHVPLSIGVLPTVMMAIGFVVAWYFYIRRPDIPVELARQHDLLYKFLLNKWYFDETLRLSSSCAPAKRLGRLLWKDGDGRIIDGLGPDGVSARVLDVTRNVVRLQTRLSLSLRLRHADRRGGLHHLVHVRGEIIMNDQLAHPLARHLPAAARRRAASVAWCAATTALANGTARWIALWTTLVTFAISLVLVWPLRSGARRNSSSSRSIAWLGIAITITWAWTAFRCCSWF